MPSRPYTGHLGEEGRQHAKKGGAVNAERAKAPASPHEQARARKAAQAAEIAAMLRHLSAKLYDGEPFPAREGGEIFDEVARRYGWKSGHVAVLAKGLGLWPWTEKDFAVAIQPRPDSPDDGGEDE